METLFDVLVGIRESVYAAETLKDNDLVIGYAAAYSVDINSDQAASIIRVANRWIDEQENGNGEIEFDEWSRMREEAKSALTCYMHTHSGDVATFEMWKNDFDAMDVESWFGKPAEECTDLHWLSDNNSLVEVEWIAGEWVES